MHTCIDIHETMTVNWYGSIIQFCVFMYWNAILLLPYIVIIARLQQSYICVAFCMYIPVPEWVWLPWLSHWVVHSGVWWSAKVVDLIADEVQSTNHTNGSVILFLPLRQWPTDKNVVDRMTVDITKFNTVPTNKSEDIGNIVIEMVTWGTSAVFGELDLTRTYI